MALKTIHIDPQTNNYVNGIHSEKAAPGTFGAVEELIKERGLRFADFWFTDLSGIPWRITMPASALNEKLFVSGLPLDGQPVGGSWNGVMLLVPQINSVYPDTAASAPTLAMICDILDPHTKEPLALEPRHILKRAQQRVRDRLGASVTIGAEPEFFVFDANGEPAAESVTWDFLRILAIALGESGIQVDWFRTGPAIGQGRVQMRSASPLQIADQVMLYRHLTSSLARWHHVSATFLPRPTAGSGIAGFPVHQTLWKDGQNLFHDGNGWALTSRLCRWYAGGILAHLSALLAFCAPTTNSYRRLIPGVSGPTEARLSASLRTAACRIPARSDAPEARRIKFCTPDSTANPYLAFAAIILAGLDGIERQIEAPLDGDKPMPISFPQSLEAALECLNSDRSFLTRAGVFSDSLIEAWIANRWRQQVLPVRSRPHPLELANAEPFGRPHAAESLSH